EAHQEKNNPFMCWHMHKRDYFLFRSDMVNAIQILMRRSAYTLQIFLSIKCYYSFNRNGKTFYHIIQTHRSNSRSFNYLLRQKWDMYKSSFYILKFCVSQMERLIHEMVAYKSTCCIGYGCWNPSVPH